MIVYRNAVSTDLAALDAMTRRIWQVTYGFDLTEEDLTEYFGDAFGPQGALARHLEDPTWDYQVALSDGDMIGVVCIGPVQADLPVEAAGASQLRHLYVDPRYHAHGVAATLLDWAQHRARAVGASAMVLAVRAENGRAVRFYEKHGLAIVGERLIEERGGLTRELVMQAAL